MKRPMTDINQKEYRTSLFKDDEAGEAENKARAGQRIAALYRCGACSAWWGSSAHAAAHTALLLRLVEPHSTEYLWVDYHGWREDVDAGSCPGCGQETGAAAIALHFDAQGQVAWPQEASPAAAVIEAGNADDLFAEYVSGSAMMDENIAAIAAREARGKTHAWGYTADIGDIREELEAQRGAFKHLLSGYAPLLPPGWRIIGDYDKWVKGQACAGFLHGDMQPDASLLIGGGCSTVADLEMGLDRLFNYVCGGSA